MKGFRGVRHKLVAAMGATLLVSYADAPVRAQIASIDSMFETLASERRRAVAAVRPRATRVRPAVAPSGLQTREIKKLDAVGTANRTALMPVLESVKPAGLPLSLAVAVVTLESAWHIDARGLAGEIGLMQIRPVTALRFGEHGDVVPAPAASAASVAAVASAGAGTNAAVRPAVVSQAASATASAASGTSGGSGIDEARLFDPKTNLRIGMRFLHWCYQRARGNVGVTIGCYNAGPSKMQSWAFNPITRRYVSQVSGYMGVAMPRVISTSGSRRRTPVAAAAAPVSEWPLP